jgi:2-methylcitrate dehydratase PrpD
MGTVSQELAGWITGFTSDQAPDTEVEGTRKALLNSIGTAMGGYSIDSTQRSIAYVKAQATYGSAPVLVDGTQLAPAGPAFVNGVMTNALGQEETHLTSGTHPAETTVPTVLALGAQYHSSGREVVDALLVGMQVTMAIASMELTPAVKYELCQAPAVFGTIGAAAAGARLVGLDAEQTANALGLAAMFAAGLAESIRAGTGEYHYLKGLSGQHAVMAVELAKTGARSAPKAFEGNGGYYRMFSGISPERLDAFDVAGDVLRRASSDWQISGLIYKPYPSNYFNMPFIDGARRLREVEGLNSADITSIDIEVGSYASRSGGLTGPPFVHRGSCLSSTQFGVNTMLSKGELTLTETLNRDDPELLRLCGVTTIKDVGGLTTAHLNVRTADRSWELDLEAEGHDYRLPTNQVAEIAKGIAAEAIGADQATDLVARLIAVDDVADISELNPLLSKNQGKR